MHARSIVRLLSPFALAILLVPLAGCGGDEVSRDAEGNLVLGRAEVTEELTRSVAPGTRTLVLEGFSGTIALEGSDGSDADLTFIKRARGDDDEAARRRLADVELEETGDAEAYRFIARTGAPERTSVDVRGTVPRSTRLAIRLANGEVLLSDVLGPLSLEVENGVIRAAGVGESAEAETRNGTIELGYRRLPAGSTVRATAANGNILLAVPASAAGRIDARTSVGNIATGDLQFARQDFENEGAGRRFAGQLGDGTAEIVLRTENGNVTLREGDLDVDLGTMPEPMAGQAAEAIEEDVASDDPRTPIPMTDSVRQATPEGPDTSLLDADTTVQRPQGDF